MEVSSLFGDYGSGAIADSLSGKPDPLRFMTSMLSNFAVKYLSSATSTFILRVSRAHYRMAWAALSLMTLVPVKNGKNCVFRVVRVSGTIRKAEEEAVRRAREMILKARRELGERGDSALENMFGKGCDHVEADSSKDILMVDRSDSEGEEEPSDEDGEGHH